MSSFGQNLRQEREARGIALEDISNSTKISVRLLQAIECEEFDRLPGGVFNVNFVRQYARHVGLDQEKVVAEFRLLTAPPAEAGSPEERNQFADAEYEWDRGSESRAWMPATAAVMVLALAGAYFWVGRRESAPQAVSKESSQQEASPGAVVAPEPPRAPQQETAVAEAKPPEPVPEKTTPSPEPGSGAADAPVRLEMQATDIVWVSASADGRLQFEALLQPQQTRAVTAKSAVRLRVGDAAALTVTFNGVVQPALGAKGHVKTIMFTPNGIKIVASDPDPEEEEDPATTPESRSR